jgi:lauroyl/myristoyl acyltransferase
MNAYHYFLWGTRLAPLVPERLGKLLCDIGGTLGYKLVKGQRETILKNLAIALPDRTPQEREKIAREVFKSNVHYYYDTLRVHKIPPRRMRHISHVYGIHETLEIMKQQGAKGILLFSGHTGSFNMAIQSAGQVGVATHLLVEPIKPPELYDLIKKLRESDPNIKLIPVGGVGVREVFRALKHPRAVTILAIDRDVTGGGQPLKFFGRDAKLPGGIAELALRTGALLVPVYTYRHGLHYGTVIEFERAFVAKSSGNSQEDVKNIMEHMLQEIERHIRLHPEQWLCTQPIWE